MATERSISGTKKTVETIPIGPIIEMLRGVSDADIAREAVKNISKVDEMVQFRNNYEKYLKDNSNSQQARENPKRAAKENILKAVWDLAGPDETIDVWMLVIEGRVGKADKGRQVPTRKELIDRYERSKVQEHAQPAE